MTAFVRMGLAAAVCGLLATAPGLAEDNLDSGKTPAQLFASNCAICHKTPQVLSKAGNAMGGVRGLQAFLREHYTASREVAAAIAAYVQAAGQSPPPGEKKRATKPKTDSKTETKASETKLEDGTAAAATVKGDQGTKPEPAPESKPDADKKSD
jgi:mono/diheme cytochrome c family protein